VVEGFGFNPPPILFYLLLYIILVKIKKIENKVEGGGGYKIDPPP
jgi:hypothetical protein